MHFNCHCFSKVNPTPSLIILQYLSFSNNLSFEFSFQVFKVFNSKYCNVAPTLKYMFVPKIHLIGPIIENLVFHVVAK